MVTFIQLKAELWEKCRRILHFKMEAEGRGNQAMKFYQKLKRTYNISLSCSSRSKSSNECQAEEREASFQKVFKTVLE